MATQIDTKQKQVEQQGSMQGGNQLDISSLLQWAEQQSANRQKQQLMSASELVGKEIPIQGSKVGMMGAIGGLIQGKGFDPNAPQRIVIGPETAFKLAQSNDPMDILSKLLSSVKSTQDISQSSEKFPLEMENLQTQIQKGKTDIEQMNPEFKVGQAKKEAQAKGSFLTANDIFGKFQQATQPFVVQRDAYSRIRESGQDPSPAGDLALLYGYMKLLDPGSTVREGEFASAQNSGSVPQRIQGLYNRVISGKRLSNEQRDDFLNRSQRIYSSAEAQYGKTRKEFTKLSIANKLDPESVLVDLGIENSQENGKTTRKVGATGKAKDGTPVVWNGKNWVAK